MSYEAAFAARVDLNQYDSNALLLFALELRFGIEDIHTVAADSMTDGRDDKKCDLVYIDRDKRLAVIAQSYFTKDLGKKEKEAPAYKASDLNTASSWLINREISELPERLRPSAIQLREVIRSNEINTLQIWYVHNCSESKNVQNELKTVQMTAHSSLQRLLDDRGMVPNVTVLEVGKSQLENWYNSLATPILVSESFEVEVPGGYPIEGNDWEAFVTAVPASWLYKVYNSHKSDDDNDTDLFSANIRGYLGSRQSDKNINNGIKNTASSDPEHFWVYNNGLTILTHKWEYDKDNKLLAIDGMSIVNGAQTTGAIGSLQDLPENEAMVPARFIRCNNESVIKQIIRYNNSQNQIEAPDFRSGDDIQKRLRDEFCSISTVTYSGGRRGGYEDKIKRPSNILPSDTVGQALAAFHRDPLTAYNEKSKIWISDTLYSKYFSERTTAKHIIFCYSLLRSVEERKRKLQTKSNQGELTEKQEQVLSFFRNRGSTFLFVAAISASLESILGRAISDRFSLSFESAISLSDAIQMWEPIIDASSPFVDRLVPAVERGLNNAEKARVSISEFASFIDATKEFNESKYSGFARIVEV